MTENSTTQIDDDEPENRDQHNERNIDKVYAQAGFPFPMGPVIPRPDATWPPLWPGLVQPGLNRPRAAAAVMVDAYLDHSKSECWKLSKEPLTSRMDLTFRNLYQRVHTQNDPEVLNTAQVPLRVLEGWVKVAKGNKVCNDFAELVNEKLHPDLLHFHHKGRNNARDQSLLFAPPHYPTAGHSPVRQPASVPWVIRYSEQTRNHVRELLGKSADEWDFLTLLFNKLLHAHMAWLAPTNIRQQRQVHYYRPLLKQLKQCAQQLGTLGAYPLAETAAGLWLNLRRMNVLVHWPDERNPLFPKNSDPINPRHEDLPDSLHMDSGMGVNDCLGEVAQILKWMDEEDEGGDWAGLLPKVDEVATLAWDMASARTDPFAMGGLGIAVDNAFKTTHNFKRHLEGWQEVVKGVRARVQQLRGNGPTKSLASLPGRFRGHAADEGQQIDQLEAWAERPAQLRLYCETTFKMLESHKLDQFQSKKGNNL